MTQKSWILEYIKKYGYVTPARMGGKHFIDSDGVNNLWPACGMRRCQEMETDGILVSEIDGKFKKFKFPETQANLFSPADPVKETARSGQVFVNGNWFRVVK